MTSWGLWAFIGLGLLVTYKGSGAEDSVWPSVFSFSNSSIITGLIAWRIKKTGRLEKLDRWSIALTVISLGVWIIFKNSPELVQYALYISILADGFAALPMLQLAWKAPWDDRPFAWGLFVIGYGLSFFAIEEMTIANLSLPFYMVIVAGLIAWPLITYRLKNQVPLREWI